jgi:UPF0042 nucleotide-binding protein
MSDSTPLVLVSGLSGSGKSAALRCLGDLGYYCVDNLPPPLMETLVDLLDRAVPSLQSAALSVDVRGRAFLDQFAELFTSLRERRGGVQLLFLDAEDAVLQQRFSETRRPHPLIGDDVRGVADGIRRERERLASIRLLADRVIDTSNFTERDLRDFLTAQLGGDTREGLNISVMSFGYRRGLPANADLVFDVRFLPNPHYVPELKDLTGMDNAVVEFVESHRETGDFLRLMQELLGFLIPQYGVEGKTYLTLAFGCTGGQHRSVAIARRVAMMLGGLGYRVSLIHRDAPGLSQT